MKSHKKPILFSMIFILALSSIFIIESKAKDYTSSIVASSMSSIMKTNATVLMQRMISQFPTEVVSNETQPIYPSDYAGAYVDLKNNLHIRITKGGNIDFYRKFFPNDSNVIFETASTSLNDLHTMNALLVKKMADYKITCISLNDILQRYVNEGQYN